MTPELSESEAPTRERARLRRRVLVLAALAVIAAGLLLLLRHNDPTQVSFLPRCVLHDATGLHCPGCGSTRATHALLHLDLARAWAMNPLLVLLIPLLGLLTLREVHRYLYPTRRPLFSPKLPAVIPARWIVTLLALVLAYGVFRNLPFAPFRWLAPQETPGIEQTTPHPPGARKVPLLRPPASHNHTATAPADA